MAGTYIQGDVYGQIPDVTPLFNARADDDTLLRTIRDVPAVAAARKACDWVVVTAMYPEKARSTQAAEHDDPGVLAGLCGSRGARDGRLDASSIGPLQLLRAQ